MADSDLQKFTAALLHAPQTKRFPDEMAYSYPVPLKNHHVAVYAYMLVGKPPDMPRVAAPESVLEASFPDGQVLELRSFAVQKLGVRLQDGGTLGQVHFPSEYLLMTPEEFNRREHEFQHVYARAIDAYFVNDHLDAKSANKVLAELPVFGKAPLLPLFRATNPEFFSWLESEGRR